MSLSIRRIFSRKSLHERNLEILEEERRQEEIDNLIHEIESIQSAFNAITISASTAVERFTEAWMALAVNCKTCSCEQKHHNPDKRTTTGFGKCLCGHCYKYRPMALVTINSLNIKDIYLSNPITVNNGDSLSVTYTVTLK